MQTQSFCAALLSTIATLLCSGMSSIMCAHWRPKRCPWAHDHYRIIGFHHFHVFLNGVTIWYKHFKWSEKVGKCRPTATKLAQFVAQSLKKRCTKNNSNREIIALSTEEIAEQVKLKITKYKSVTERYKFSFRSVSLKLLM